MESAVYRFVGVSSEVGAHRLDRFGQRVTLSASEADNAIAGGAALIPEGDFEEIGLTDQEIDLYAYVGQQMTAPEVFRRKLEAARDAFRQAHYAGKE